MTRAPAVVLAVIAVSLGACGRREPTPPAAVASSTPPAAATADEKAFLALLPASGAAANWSRIKEPRRYSQADLWEYIDGAAEAYLAFGFQELATAGYALAPAGTDVTADLFRMADPVSAFGIFAQERAASCDAVSVGVEGCSAGGVLAFWSGPYFVKLTAFKDTPDTRQALVALASAAAAALGPPGAAPLQVGWFPTRNLVPRSVRFVPKDALGQSYLTNAFEAQYKDGAVTSKLIVIAFESADAASAALSEYRAFIGSGGKATRSLPAPGEAAFSGADAYYGAVIAARAGTSVAISLGPPSEKAGRALIDACFARMRTIR
jgi:predicted small lipoprotein YifL